jgi:DNA-binding transcriptional regulator YdaS (Cro superfamily)
MLNAAEIVEALDGTNAAARFFGVKPPSVSEWVKKGEIPEDKLIKKAASLERALNGKFTRRSQWPDTFGEIWPELERRAVARLPEISLPATVGEA